MAEQVKVFKNVNNVTPSSMDVDVDINLLTTLADESAVIKDVVFTGGWDCTLDLDGFAVSTGVDIAVEGNLIMGPSSTLKVVSKPSFLDPSFKGMFFTQGTSAIQFLEGNGTDINLTSTQASATATPANSACAAEVGGELFFYRLAVNTIYQHNAAGAIITSWSYGGSGFQMDTDGEYIYRAGTGTTNSIFRTKLSDLTNDTLTTNYSYAAPGGNQGSYFLYHDGKLYSKSTGGIGYIDILDLSTLLRERITDANFNVGNYSEGATVVTTTAGVSYIVEQGATYWSYLNLATNVVVRVAEGVGSSTEYGNGAGEIAPGIALIFGEKGDIATIIDMNTVTRTQGPGTDYATVASFSNIFAFADYLQRPVGIPYTYNAFTTGVHITGVGP